MHVISRKRLLEFAKAYPDAAAPLDAWFRVMKAARFTSPAVLKKTFGSVDFLGQNKAVFNIGGNKYRLIVNIRYTTESNIGRVYVREVLTHEQYDRWSDEHRKRK